MPLIYDLILEEAQTVTLTEMRDHHPKAYMRERAGALLKVASGQSIQAVAQRGLLRPRKWDTVAGWVKGYERRGLGGLYLRPGRGRKPAFPPSIQHGHAGKRALGGGTRNAARPRA